MESNSISEKFYGLTPSPLLKDLYYSEINDFSAKYNNNFIKYFGNYYERIPCFDSFENSQQKENSNPINDDEVTKSKTPEKKGQIILYNMDEINKILSETDLDKDLKSKIKEPNNETQKLYEKMEEKLNKKRKSNSKEEKNIGPLLGKKTNRNNQENEKIKHDSHFPYNIAKEIKTFFFKFILIFLNNIVNENYFDKKNTNLIKSLDHKTVVQDLKKDKNENFLQMKLMDIFKENKISKKNRADKTDKVDKADEESNKNNINEIYEKCNKVVKFAFDLTFKQWIDIFTYKVELENYLGQDYDLIEELKGKFVRIDKALNEKYEKEFKDNFQSFLLIIYNYEAFSYIKNSRSSRRK